MSDVVARPYVEAMEDLVKSLEMFFEGNADLKVSARRANASLPSATTNSNHFERRYYLAIRRGEGGRSGFGTCARRRGGRWKG